MTKNCFKLFTYRKINKYFLQVGHRKDTPKQLLLISNVDKSYWFSLSYYSSKTRKCAHVLGPKIYRYFFHIIHYMRTKYKALGSRLLWQQRESPVLNLKSGRDLHQRSKFHKVYRCSFDIIYHLCTKYDRCRLNAV